MDARRLLLAPLMVFARGPAVLGARVLALLCWLAAIGAVAAVGFAGPAALAFLWVAGLGILGSRAVRRRLAGRRGADVPSAMSYRETGSGRPG